MSRKTLWISTGIYIFSALLWTVNFFLHWRRDGMIQFSTALFGVAAVCFAVSTVLNLIRIRRLKKEE